MVRLYQFDLLKSSDNLDTFDELLKEVNEDYTVFDYQKDARKCIKQILNKNKTPIIVGGTGLYIKISSVFTLSIKNEIVFALASVCSEQPGKAA